MSFLKNLFSPEQVQAPQINAPANITGFSGGGLSGGFNPSTNNYSVGATADRTAAVGGVASTFGQQAGDIGNLRAQWAPGSSALRSSLEASLNSRRTSSLGNLRDNLAQRRILGSSFAQNSLATADQEYQQKDAEIQAQTFMQELAAQQQLIQQQYTAARGQFQTSLDEMNLEAGIATDLTSKATSALTSAATTQAQLDLQARTTNAKTMNDAAGGFGKFVGTVGGAILGGPVGAAIGGGLGGMFGGGVGSYGQTSNATGLGGGTGGLSFPMFG